MGFLQDREANANLQSSNPALHATVI